MSVAACVGAVTKLDNILTSIALHCFAPLTKFKEIRMNRNNRASSHSRQFLVALSNQNRGRGVVIDLCSSSDDDDSVQVDREVVLPGVVPGIPVARRHDAALNGSGNDLLMVDKLEVVPNTSFVCLIRGDPVASIGKGTNKMKEAIKGELEKKNLASDAMFTKDCHLMVSILFGYDIPLEMKEQAGLLPLSKQANASKGARAMVRVLEGIVFQDGNQVDCCVGINTNSKVIGGFTRILVQTFREEDAQDFINLHRNRYIK